MKVGFQEFIKIEYYIHPKNSLDHIQRRIFTYYDSLGSHQEPSSDCELDLVMPQILDYLPLHWLLVVNKGL